MIVTFSYFRVFVLRFQIPIRKIIAVRIKNMSNNFARGNVFVENKRLNTEQMGARSA